MNTVEKCPRCGAPVIGQKLGGLCRRCVRKAVSAGLEQFHNDLAPIQEEAVQPKPTPFAFDDPLDDAVGQVIGRYKLREKIGEGGGGVVYVAEQTEPVRRRVALKLIKPGMDTKQVIARFEAERQALAMMDHPNIARVFDAGTTDTGRPYFVMELVPGIKITEFCDENKLSTRERLDLFIRVCHAIQHAHQKGIIHRDIKPSNVLVTLHDDQPVPKVIDFGIAKATEGRLTDATVYTQMQQFIGTPAYMSPEQARMSGLDIDTRSDIYSLGVLLYELLTGGPPFDEKELRSMGLEAMCATIREKEPTRPSTKLSQLVAANKAGRVAPCAGSSGELASNGGARGVTRPAAQSKEGRASARGLLQTRETIALLRGDLDWIVMKCLEKDRKRRYETANGLAADIGRHLNNEPVVARPPSAAYRFQKAWQRNKIAFAAGAAVAGALIVGIALTSWQMAVARQARKSETVQRTKAEASERQALANAREARANLYHALLGQMKATRIARQVGYREETFDLVRQALELHVPEMKLSDLRREAVGSMGDFVGFRPRRIATGAFGQESRMRLSSDGHWLELRDVNGQVSFLALPSGRETGPSTPEFQEASFAFQAPADPPPSDSIERPAGPWSPVAASRDGRKLALRGRDAAEKLQPDIEIWDLPGKRLLGVLPQRPGEGSSLTFSADGRYLLGVSERGARVYDAGTCEIVDEFSGPLTPWNFGSFLPGTALLAVPLPQQALFRIRDCLKKETVAVLQENSETLQAIFAPGGEFLLTRNSTGVNLYEFGSAREYLTLVGHPASVTGIAFSPDGSRLASVSKDRTVRQWDARSGRRIWEGDRMLPNTGQAVTFSPDGRLLATGTSATSLVQLWDAESGRQVREFEAVGGWTWTLQFVADGEKGPLLARGSFHGVRAWQIGDPRAVLDGRQREDAFQSIILNRSETALGIVPSPTGRMVAFVKRPFDDPTLVIQDASGKEPQVVVAPLTPVGSVQSVAFVPDGRSVVFLTKDHRVAVVNSSSGTLKRAFPVSGSSEKPRVHLALSAKGRWLAVSSETRRGVEIYDFVLGEPRYALPDREGTVYWLAWDPSDEARLAVACDNGGIAIWDLAKIDRQLADLGLGFTAEPPENATENP